MTWELWTLFVATEAVLSLAPGPAVLAVLSHGLRYGVRASLWVSTGILLGNIGYFVLSATSLGAVLATSQAMFVGLKWAGACYLVYLGLRALLGYDDALPAEDDAQANAVTSNDAHAEGLPSPRSQLQSQQQPQPRPMAMLARGFALQAANPKAILYFTAILPQFLDPDRPLGWQVAILGVSSIVVEFGILWGYGGLASLATRWAGRPAFNRWTNRAAGSLLILAAVGLARLRRE